jgi:hypothetical protein
MPKAARKKAINARTVTRDVFMQLLYTASARDISGQD